MVQTALGLFVLVGDVTCDCQKRRQKELGAAIGFVISGVLFKMYTYVIYNHRLIDYDIIGLHFVRL